MADAQKNGYIGRLNEDSIEGLNSTQIFGAVLGHEIEHTTKENAILQNTPNVTESQIEKVPTDISKKIIEESKRELIYEF
ncbi:MAG: hypothetical protein LBE34_00045 [Flavobacteriaceae bacterium]|jgi:hypothetical protein|nr:hypothetical protein [Flavobacteriaceae bacterium]